MLFSIREMCIKTTMRERLLILLKHKMTKNEIYILTANAESIGLIWNTHKVLIGTEYSHS